MAASQKGLCNRAQNGYQRRSKEKKGFLKGETGIRQPE